MNPLMNFSTGNSRYYKQFNLTIDPFPVEADNIMYQTPGINLRLERIKESIAGSQKTIVITSSPGAGKSTLADYLEAQPESNWKICLIQAEDGMTSEKIAFEIIRQAMPDKAEETSRAIPLLHKYLELASRNEFIPVFIIDDADKLSLETLKFLLELATLRYAESLFRIVLFADESLVDRLADPDLNSLVTGMTYNLHLPSLSRSQSREYIDTRLHAAGEISDYPFNEENLDYIYRISGGLPAGINIAARQIMQTRNVTTAPEPVHSSKGKWLTATAVLLVGGFAAYLLLFQGNTDTPQQATTITAVTPVTPAPTEPQASVEPEPQPEAEIANTQADPIADSLPDVTAEPATESEPVDTSAATEASETETPAIDQSQSAVASEQPIETPTEPVAPVEPIVNSAPVTEVPAEPVSTPVVTNRAPDDNNIFNLANIPAQVNGIRGNSWYRSQPGTSYTLQLISASRIENVLEILDDVPGIQAELSGYVKYTPSGKPRYLMFYGLYADKAAADAAISSLPAGLQAVNPWSRSIRNITDEMDTVKLPAPQ